MQTKSKPLALAFAGACFNLLPLLLLQWERHEIVALNRRTARKLASWAANRASTRTTTTTTINDLRARFRPLCSESAPQQTCLQTTLSHSLARRSIAGSPSDNKSDDFSATTTTTTIVPSRYNCQSDTQVKCTFLSFGRALGHFPPDFPLKTTTTTTTATTNTRADALRSARAHSDFASARRSSLLARMLRAGRMRETAKLLAASNSS